MSNEEQHKKEKAWKKRGLFWKEEADESLTVENSWRG